MNVSFCVILCVLTKLGVDFEVFIWPIFGEFWGIILYWKNVYFKYAYLVLCSLLLLSYSSQLSLTHRIHVSKHSQIVFETGVIIRREHLP